MEGETQSYALRQPAGIGFPDGLPASCYIDDAPAPCGLVYQMLQSGAAQPQPPAGYVPVSKRGQDTCPGCYVDPSSEDAGNKWDPNDPLTWGPKWYFTTLSQDARAVLTQVAKDASQGNAAGLQIGRWNISHPSPEVCGDVRKWSIGLMLTGATALAVGGVFPVVAPVTELYGYPAAGAGAVFGIYYAAFCRPW